MAEFVVDPRSLNRWVRIRRRDVVRGVGGRETVTWPVRVTVRASKRDISGREQVTAGQINPESISRFIVRWLPGVEHTDRIECEGVQYEVTALAEIGVRQWWDITARRVVQP